MRGGKMILVLHDKIPSWNELYSQKHWSKRYDLANSWKTTIFWECKEQGLQPVKTYPITLKITSNQRCDLDNLCVKLVIDGLKLAGIIDDDDPKHIDMITIIHDKTQKFTTVEIHEEDLTNC